MIKQEIKIEGIPAILWGSKSNKLFIAVHGNMSNKADTVIAIFAEEAVSRGFQVLSFDLPEHGDRVKEARTCSVQNCVNDIGVIFNYAQESYDRISLFACSMGAYFSLLACADKQLEQSLFLSPVTDMERIIRNMMQSFNISEERLKAEKEIPTPAGQSLYWDYFQYVISRPISVWHNPTFILYGSLDFLCEADTVKAFAEKFGCGLKVMENGEHFFHTEEQLAFFRNWLIDCLPSCQ